jgi:hypothetical protein
MQLISNIFISSNKVLKICFLSITLLLTSQISFGQVNWELKKSVLKVPEGFKDWIIRNVGSSNANNAPIGSIIGTNQHIMYVDFNKDGRKDICIQMYLSQYMGSKKDSAYRYHLGIFLQEKEGNFLLDTNFIITGRGLPWYGVFGDYNGDGKIDFFQPTENYHGDQQKKPKDLFKYGNTDASPSHVFLNNGSGFDLLDIDTVNMISTNATKYDINNDGKDEIISNPSEKFSVYEYNASSKNFKSQLNNINDSITKWYGRTIKWFNYSEIINNKLKLTVSHNSFNPNKEEWKIDILEINLKDSTIIKIREFNHPSYKNSNGEIANATIHAKPIFKEFDLNNDNKNELIMISPYSFSGNERMGFDIIQDNKLVTSNYWSYDTTEVGFRIGGFITDLSGDRFPDILPGEWKVDTIKKQNGYLYKFENGKFKKNTIDPVNSNKVKLNEIYGSYWVSADDLYKDGYDDIFIINPNNFFENYIYATFNCLNRVIKPTFNTTKYSFCTGDSLKLTVSNINKGDSLKWYYGTKSDLTNVSNKTFTDSTKLFVTRTDSLGCIISSDTIQIKKYGIPSAPSITRDTANFLLSGAAGTTWYKDGSAITDTAQKYKPTAAGSYTAKTTTNGCTSVMSSAYYYLVTDIINLSKDEYIKLAPNPFINQLNFDFIVKGYQRLNIEVFDVATGTKVASQPNLTAGSRITLGHLSSGTYIIRVTSNDQKLIQQFKVVKM